MTLLPHSPDHPCENCHILKIAYNQLFLTQVANIWEAQLICDSSRTREWSQKFFLCLFAAVLEMILQPGLVHDGEETEGSGLTMLYLLGNDGRPAVAQLLLRLHHRLFPPPPILQLLFSSLVLVSLGLHSASSSLFRSILDALSGNSQSVNFFLLLPGWRWVLFLHLGQNLVPTTTPLSPNRTVRMCR